MTKTKRKSPHSSESSPRTTKQRTLILKILELGKKPISAPQIVKEAQKKIPLINKTTVYRTLERLLDEELVNSVMVAPSVLHYELTKGDSDHHHHHFVCRACNGVFCLEGCTAGFAKMLPKGFILDTHDLTLHGICAQCNDKD